MSTISPTPVNFSIFINNLRTRSEILQRNARWVIILIVIVLLAGILSFIFAGQLGVRELTEARTTLLQREIDAINGSIDSNNKEMISLQRRIEQEASQQRSGASSETFLNYLKARLSAAQDREQSLRESLEKLNQQQFELTDLTKLAPNSYAIVSAITTRVGSILLLLFLVRILVPLYRYNIRLAAYYDARADALEVTRLNKDAVDKDEVDIELFEKLTSSLSPDSIDFAKPPSAPTQEVLDFLKQVLTSKQIR